jgi:hypothetical protein
MLFSCIAYLSTLKRGATFSFETSVDFQRSTLCDIPEYRTEETWSEYLSDLIINRSDGGASRESAERLSAPLQRSVFRSSCDKTAVLA